MLLRALLICFLASSTFANAQSTAPKSTSTDPHAGHNMAGMGHGAPMAAMDGMGLKSSVPANGAVLKASPKAITLTLDHPMTITSLTLTNKAGQRMPLAGTIPKAAVTTLTIPVRPLAPSTYAVSWAGSGMGHAMKGGFSFTVQ
jgi:methionine-rich copper-binding protein CopC